MITTVLSATLLQVIVLLGWSPSERKMKKKRLNALIVAFKWNVSCLPHVGNGLQGLGGSK